MAEQQVISETQRPLQAVTFAENVIVSRDLPRDTVIKSIASRLDGNVVTTFASGTPVSSLTATLDNLCPRVDVTVNGSTVIKSVRPYAMRMQTLLTTGNLPERLSSSGAAAVVKATASAGFTYGTTGQITSCSESMIISFECTVAETGRESTYLNLKGVASAEIKYSFAAFSTLLGFGNTAPVVFTASTLAIAITTVEAQAIDSKVQFGIFKQTTREIPFAAQATEQTFDINRGNFLIGCSFIANDGAAGTTTTATGKVLSNKVLSSMKLVLNGVRTIKSTTWFELQAEMQARYGVSNAYVSNVAPMDGYAYFNFLEGAHFGQIATALDTRPPLTDQVQLSLSTRAAADVSYTNPCTVSIQTNELITPSR